LIVGVSSLNYKDIAREDNKVQIVVLAKMAIEFPLYPDQLSFDAAVLRSGAYPGKEYVNYLVCKILQGVSRSESVIRRRKMLKEMG